jgi:hypothetical protein
MMNRFDVEEPSSRSRTWREEADMLLSLLSCVVPEKEAVFASSEFFTGKRFYDLCLNHEVRTHEKLEQKLGPQYRHQLLNQNRQQGMAFARSLRELGHKFVLTPLVFEADDVNQSRKWSGDEYLAFWDLVIAKKCHTVYLNEFWQFSDSCVFQFMAGLNSGKKLIDHAGNFLALDAGRKLVLSATRRLEDFGFDVPNLDEALLKLKSFSSLG